MKLFFALIFLSLHCIACGQNPPKTEQNIFENQTMENPKTEDEKAIIAVANQLSALMIAKDLDGMNPILDDNYSLTHMTGYVQPKAEWFEEVKAESMKYYSVTEVSKTLKISGNKAELIDRNLVDARIWGSRHTWRLQQILTLEKRNGKWIILKSVASTF